MPQVNLDQLQNELKLAEAEAELWQQKIATYREKGKKERTFIATLGRRFDLESAWPEAAPVPPQVQRMTGGYLEAHKSHEDAEVQLMELQLARLKSKAAITQELLNEANKSVLLGGSAGLRRQ